MGDIKKTSLEEAKTNWEQIRKFATEAAKKEFENEINDKVNKMLEESLSVEVDDEDNATIIKDDNVVEITNDGEVEVESKEKHDDEMMNDDGENYHDDDDEEIEIEKNIDEMIEFEQEQPQSVAPAPEAIAAPATEEIPAEMPNETTSAVDNDVLELAQIIEKIIDKKVGNTEDTDQAVDFIDDETAEMPAEAPAAPAPAPASAEPIAPAPVQEEDELLEFNLDEIDEFELADENENEIFEFDIPDSQDDEYIEIDDNDPEAMLTALGDISREKPNWKDDVPSLNIPKIEDEDELDEIKGQGKLVRNTSHRLGLEPREGTPNLNESIKTQKAHYESKIDELKKENISLTESVKEMSGVIKDYQNSFKDLRKQFDEMQTFNAKLAYANKIFASGGLSTSDKAKIAEEFDKTQSIDEAKKLYNKILSENKISTNRDNASKIKAPTTNTIKSKDIVYESTEMRRSKVLAGIVKDEDYL
jgi:hypothetical protein